MDKQSPELINFKFPKSNPAFTLNETEDKLKELREKYKRRPDKITLIRGKLLKYALELKMKKAGYIQSPLPQTIA